MNSGAIRFKETLLAAQRKPNYRRAIESASRKFRETTELKKWDAKKAIRRRPNNYEHVGLWMPDALARIRELADAAEEYGPGYIVEHVKELAPCLFVRPSATRVAEGRNEIVDVPRKFGASNVC